MGRKVATITMMRIDSEDRPTTTSDGDPDEVWGGSQRVRVCNQSNLHSF